MPEIDKNSKTKTFLETAEQKNAMTNGRTFDLFYFKINITLFWRGLSCLVSPGLEALYDNRFCKPGVTCVRPAMPLEMWLTRSDIVPGDSSTHETTETREISETPGSLVASEVSFPSPESPSLLKPMLGVSAKFLKL